MTEPEAIEAIYAQFVAVFAPLRPRDASTYPDVADDPAYVAYAFKGETFDPSQVGTLGAWLMVSVNHTVGAQTTMGSAPNRKFERRGNVMVQIFTPANKGVSLAAALAANVRTALEGVRLTELRLHAAVTRETPTDGAYTMSVVVVEFSYTETR